MDNKTNLVSPLREKKTGPGAASKVYQKAGNWTRIDSPVSNVVDSPRVIPSKTRRTVQVHWLDVSLSRNRRSNAAPGAVKPQLCARREAAVPKMAFISSPHPTRLVRCRVPTPILLGLRSESSMCFFSCSPDRARTSPWPRCERRTVPGTRRFELLLPTGVLAVLDNMWARPLVRPPISICHLQALRSEVVLPTAQKCNAKVRQTLHQPYRLS